MTGDPTPGQLAYEAYDRAHGVRTPRANWGFEGRHTRECWTAAANAAIDAAGDRAEQLHAAVAENERLRQDLAAALADRDRATGHVADLERQLAAVTAERDALRAARPAREYAGQLKGKLGDSWRRMLDDANRERDDARAECDRLRAAVTDLADGYSGRERTCDAQLAVTLPPMSAEDMTAATASGIYHAIAAELRKLVAP